MITDIKNWLIGLGQGAVGAFGSPTAEPDTLAHPSGHGAVVAVRDGYKLAELPGPNQVVRRHTFDDVEGVAAWLLKHADPVQTEILVDRAGVVRALLNPRAVPTSDAVECQLQPHPRLDRWLRMLGKAIPQRDLQRLIVGALEDFPPAVTEDGKPLGSSGSLLASQLLRIDVSRGGAISSHLNELGMTTLTASSDSKELVARIPPKFAIRVPWFIGSSDDDLYDLEVHLTVTATERGVAFGLEIPGVEVVRHEALLDAVDHLRAELGDAWLVGLGRTALQTVPKVG